MKIKKIKFTASKEFEVIYSVKNVSGSYDVCSIKSKEYPNPVIRENLNQLAPVVAEICEINQKNKITVSGVSFSVNEDEGYLGATLMAQRELKNSNTNLILNTPHKFERHNKIKDEKMLLPDEAVPILYGLVKLSEGFVHGERAQINLFEEKPLEEDSE